MTAVDRFSVATREWFASSFGAPTAAQDGAWDAISAGDHTLVVAPTGSGKTLAAFLWSLDRLASTPADAPGVRVLYISPLKALAVDVERNLRAPLAGIAHTARHLGVPVPEVRSGVRTGDTPQRERAAMLRHPPDILITTPESLFLMLTSQAREILRTVDTVIIDEIHSIAGSKRGAHLALSLERLDSLRCGDARAVAAQRIGLSATVRPHDEVARYLAGARPVTVVAPPTPKRFDLTVAVPVEDMANIPAAPGDTDTDARNLSASSLWPHVEEQITDLVLDHRSTIVFANSRRLAERLTARLNEIYSERNGYDLPESPPRSPAEYIAQGGAAIEAPLVLARSHHGSVSKEQRGIIEDDLKSGRLRCVVATSSLELGIDMGAVDLVLQVEAPPSVASGLQRVGRAGHQVGEISRGVLFPKHRADLLHCAITVERMRSGKIEALRVPSNPLDVLAQQTVAACALDELHVEEWYATVRRAGPYTALPRSLFDATLDLLAGKYPSDQFAELRPRIVWDRDAGTLTGRPGAQRLAVTSGGTIPDRGSFAVMMVGEKNTRVGELDEEMVYESRVGDVFALGATSWRIEDITHDRVLVSPAPGQFGRLPFWIGDSIGRPAELGEALGAFLHEIAEDPQQARERLHAAGLDTNATSNAIAFITEQLDATGIVPSGTTLLLERFRDELGDWRLILHSPYGLPVHAPWALAINARILELHGIDGATVTTDDAIIVRLPDTGNEPPGADLFLLDPTGIEDIVTRETTTSALFAARFRECAARALLLPRRDPGKRSPLWMQRQRSAQLLDIAREHPDFPIVLEALRECLQDVYDLPGLVRILTSIERRRIRLVEADTTTPSPFAVSALFGYTGAFIYEGDAPLAERKAAALSLDTPLLAELLGRLEMRDLLDPGIIAEHENGLQRLARKADSAEQLADLIRSLGPLTTPEVIARCSADPTGWLGELADARRIIDVAFSGERWWIVIEDAGRIRDAFGAPLPQGIPATFLEPAPTALEDLVARYARTHGPFTASDITARYRVPASIVTTVLRALAAQKRVTEGEFRPTSSDDALQHEHRGTTEWCDLGVLTVLRRRSLALVRDAIQPVSTQALARFLPAWHHIGRRSLRGPDGVLNAIEQLAGLPLPASALETHVLPSRVRDYNPAHLDELTSAGEILWSGAGTISARDGWIALHLADTAHLTLPPPGEPELSGIAQQLHAILVRGGGYFFRQLAEQLTTPAPGGSFPTGSALAGDEALIAALWELVWAGQATNDTLAPVRALLASGRGGSAHRAPATARARTHRAGRAPRLPRGSLSRASLTTRSSPPTVAGRWSLVPEAETDHTLRSHGLAEQLLERYGIVTRPVLGAERAPAGTPGFGDLYKVLASLEDRGLCRRGYFVDGLGATQFATTAVVDELRSHEHRDEPDATAPERTAVTLAAIDPANAYGAALPWPDPPVPGHRAGRKAGALVVLLEGDLTLYLERGGKTMLAFTDDTADLDAAARALAASAPATLHIETINGEPATTAASSNDPAIARAGQALSENGFAAVPRGYRLRR
ncbi:ATP-dependent helicase [Hoyosella sp. G463]|uniref:ATP-dependent helicase n=1 Tax=Lolliginicoccus lacisalsi TaxID=2742202 RepID=A0A927PKL2_9ACTN|nr:ATP-dependent helicase [Lolliginicoccus lacisalsi]